MAQHCAHAHHGLMVGGKVSLVSAGVNSALAILKLGVGLWSGSKSLVADGLHSLQDVLSDGITYAAMYIGRKGADDNHPYGHGKFETFASLTLALSLLVTSIYVLWDATEAMLSGTHMAHDAGWPALVVAFISVVANEWLFRYCIKHGNAINAQILIVNAWHNRSDSLSSLAVLVGVGLGALGYPVFDTLAAIAVGIFLLYISGRLLRECFDELVETADEKLQERLKTEIAHIAGVKGIHKLRSRKVGSGVLVDLHVEVDSRLSVSEGHFIADQVEKYLTQEVPEITDAMVHIDLCGDDYRGAPFSRDEAQQEVNRVLKSVAPHLKVARLNLHLTQNARALELVLEGDVAVVKKVLPQLRTALLFPQGQFDVVNISVAV